MLKSIITYRPSFTVRIITGLIALLVSIGVCTAIGVSDVVANSLKERDAQFKGRLIEAGAKVYSEQCARCHGPEGKGVENQGPALSSKTFLGDKDTPSQRLKDIGWTGTLQAYVQAVTASGIPLKSSSVWDQVHPASSQAYGGPLRDDQIQNVTAFVLNWQQEPYTSGVVDAPKPGEGGAKATAVPLTDAQKAGQQVYLQAGCNACHAIRGAGNQGAVGPVLSKIGSLADERLKDPNYKGTSKDAVGYIQESIVNPNIFVVAQCPAGPCAAGVMTQNFGTTLKPDDLKNLVDYLASLK